MAHTLSTKKKDERKMELRMSSKLKAALEKEAKRQQRSQNQQVIFILREYLGLSEYP